MPEETFETPQTPAKGWSSSGRNWPKIILAAIFGFALLCAAAYAGYWYGTESAIIVGQKVVCGGWDTFGEVACSCEGKYEQSPCPPGAICDGGYYFCYGSCGECKCYSGPRDRKNEIPCDGRDAHFKNL